MNRIDLAGGQNVAQQAFDNYVYTAQQQVANPIPYYYPPEPTSALVTFIDLVNTYGWWAWAGIGCFAVGVITVACFFIGRSTKFALVKRLIKTWANLLKGE